MFRALTFTALTTLGACTQETAPAEGAIASGMTEEGGYHVMVDADEPLTAQAPVLLEITIHDQTTDTPFDGGTVTLTPWMASMGHGLMDGDPEVTEMGDGIYETQFQFSMAGEWELQIGVEGDTTTEQAVLDVDVL